MSCHGLFVGLVTLDLVYLTAGLPSNNQKIVASDYTVAAGGPATNAAVAYRYLGNRATLLTPVGIHPITQLIQADLKHHGVVTQDLVPNHPEPPPVSSIIITQATGERAVISLNASKRQVSSDLLPPNLLRGVDILLVDGHQMAVGETLAQQASAEDIPVVLDGGSWKLGLEKLLSFVDYAVCSANFYPPDCQGWEQVFTYLSGVGISHIAVTNGEKPIRYMSGGQTGYVEVPQITAVDTLGAGDIFHGAFCHYILEQNFVDALTAAAQVAAHSCQFFGTRRWMQYSGSLLDEIQRL